MVEGLLVVEFFEGVRANIIVLNDFLHDVGEESTLLACFYVFVFDDCLSHEMVDEVFWLQVACFELRRLDEDGRRFAQQPF